MSGFEAFFRTMYGDRLDEMLDPPVSFVDALQDLPELLRIEADKETAEWLKGREEKRVGRIAYRQTHGTKRTPEATKAKLQRKRLSKRLRDKEIFARMREVGFQNLSAEERADLAVAQHRSAAKSRRNARKQLATTTRED